jgi:(p)ppGpp synthase/HD superfamily hydrolase
MKIINFKAMNNIEKSIDIALRAHAGQVDKSGAPYILHPLRLMLRMKSESEMMAAVLHDVLEDNPAWTDERFRAEGIPEDVIEIVGFLTKTAEEKKNNYDLFIRRVAQHPAATRVKLADLEDNMNLDRISQPKAEDFERAEKSRKAQEFLTAYVR